MTRVTTAVLAEKIDNVQKTLDEDIKPAVKENTEFRLKSKGIIATIGFVAAFIGMGVAKIMKLIKDLFGGI